MSSERPFDLTWSKAPQAIAGDLLRAKRIARGLSQKELSALVPTSVTTVAWLEQGRDFALSDSLFHAMVAALQFNELEAKFVFKLRSEEVSRQTLTTSGRFWQKFIEPFVGPPMILTNRCWEVLARNDPANSDFLANPQRNAGFQLLERYLNLFNQPENVCFLHRQIDQFRIDGLGHLGQPTHTEIVTRLITKSVLFATRWHSAEFSEDGLHPFASTGQNRLQVEHLYDNERGLILHVFSATDVS